MANLNTKNLKGYRPNIYEINSDNSCRYVLGISGKSPLYVIGVNPSTANDKIPDQTIRKVIGFANRNGFDSFIMFNLYPKRTPYPNELEFEFDEKNHIENLEKIIFNISTSKSVTILAAWGESIEIRNYLKKCLIDLTNCLQDYKVKWVKIGEMTKSGHPRHPSRPSYSELLSEFDISSYLMKIK